MGTSCSDICEIVARLATVASGGKRGQGENGGGLEENVSEIFFRTRYGSESWKSGQGENGGRPGTELDDKSMAWNVSCCLGWWGQAAVMFLRFFSGLAHDSELWKKRSGTMGKTWKRVR